MFPRWQPHYELSERIYHARQMLFGLAGIYSAVGWRRDMWAAIAQGLSMHEHVLEVVS